jgi:hypothetical protein
MTELRITSSHPDFISIDRLQHLLCVTLNPQAHFDTANQYINELDKVMAYQTVYDELEKALDDARPSMSTSVFNDFVEGLL